MDTQSECVFLMGTKTEVGTAVSDLRRHVDPLQCYTAASLYRWIQEPIDRHRLLSPPTQMGPSTAFLALAAVVIPMVESSFDANAFNVDMSTAWKFSGQYERVGSAACAFDIPRDTIVMYPGAEATLTVSGWPFP